ncbi:MAG: ATP-grasp domain-containing protein [Planctomycetaceae bacterium]|nr:ATP-grasp domain-containing protein [Planctomycetaceae bacterium]
MRSLAASAIRAGLNPLCLDMFGDLDLVRMLQFESVDPDLTENCPGLRRIGSTRDIAATLQDIDSRVPLILCGGLENDVSALADLAKQRPVALSSSEAVSAAKDPDFLFPVLRANGVAVPRWRSSATSSDTSFFCESAPSAVILNGQTAQGPDSEGVDAANQTRPPKCPSWLLKKIHSSGGMGIRRISSVSECAADQLTNDYFLQEEISGQSMSATFVSDDGPSRDRLSDRSEARVELLGVTSQLVGIPELNATGFQFCGNLGPMELPHSVIDQLMNAAQTIVNAASLQGLFGIDFVLNHGQTSVIEVNPRLTASHELHEWARGDSHVLRQLATTLKKCGSRPEHEGKADVQERRASAVEAADKSRIATGCCEGQCFIRMVVYTVEAIEPTPEEVRRLMSWTRTLTRPAKDISPNQKHLPIGPDHCSHSHSDDSVVWLADVPFPQRPIPRGSPFCSIYAEIAGLRRHPDVFYRVLECLPRALRINPESLARVVDAKLTNILLEKIFHNRVRSETRQNH